jgi:glutathione S-transferase
MENNMKLYADPITVNCRKVLAGFKLMGIPYERIHVDYFVLWESNSLLQYAADKYGKSEF